MSSEMLRFCSWSAGACHTRSLPQSSRYSTGNNFARGFRRPSRCFSFLSQYQGKSNYSSKPKRYGPLSSNNATSVALHWRAASTGQRLDPHRSRSASNNPSEGSKLEPQPIFCALPYQPPSAGLLAHLPRSWIPYAELIRLDKPTGTYYLLFPCLFSTLMAATYSEASPSTVAITCVLFSIGALVMRGAGCTINDLWDRNLDPHVNRTRLRPIARGAVTPVNAVIFTGFQLLTGLAVLLQFPTSCLYYGIPSLPLVASYPLAKRVTHYPQVVLGLTFSWGAIMGFPALGVDLLADKAALRTVVALYASCISWTVLYDMIYAHMDIIDDRKVGIKSIALRHATYAKVALSSLALAQVSLLSVAGITMGAGPLFFASSCGSAAATLGLMIWKVNLKEVSSCWWWIRHGAWFTGGGITVGLLGDYLVNLNNREANSGACPRQGLTAS